MMHLTDDQLYHLAELSCNADPLNPDEEKQMEHIQSCKECFDKYCVLATILDATSLNCDLVFDPSILRDSQSTQVKKLLAAIKVTCEQVQNAISLIGKQLQQDVSTFAFEPVLATAVRGGNNGKSSILRMEDLEDEDTFFAYDAQKHQLMIQLKLNSDDNKKVKAYLKFPDNSTMEIPLTQNGIYLKGMISNIKSDNFELYIEEV